MNGWLRGDLRLRGVWTMETKEILNERIGKRIRLIVRQPNGTNSLWEGVLVGETDVNYTIKTIRGELRTEPKIWCAVEWIDGGN